MPLRAIYRQALALDEVAVNPTSGVQLPAVRGKRERIASPAEAAQLIAALPQRDRAIWATAMYAGLRSGELQALHRRARRPRHQPDPGPLELGPEGRPRRAEEPRRAAHRSRARRPAQAPARAPPRSRTARRPVLRPARRSAVLEPVGQPAGDEDVASRRSRADRPARVPPHLRLADDRRRRQREGPLDLPRARLGDHHARPLRPPLPRLRAGGRRPPRQLPGTLRRRGFRA